MDYKQDTELKRGNIQRDDCEYSTFDERHHGMQAL